MVGLEQQVGPAADDLVVRKPMRDRVLDQHTGRPESLIEPFPKAPCRSERRLGLRTRACPFHRALSKVSGDLDLMAVGESWANKSPLEPQGMSMQRPLCLVDSYEIDPIGPG